MRVAWKDESDRSIVSLEQTFNLNLIDETIVETNICADVEATF